MHWEACEEHAPLPRPADPRGGRRLALRRALRAGSAPNPFQGICPETGPRFSVAGAAGTEGPRARSKAAVEVVRAAVEAVEPVAAAAAGELERTSGGFLGSPGDAGDQAGRREGNSPDAPGTGAGTGSLPRRAPVGTPSSGGSSWCAAVAAGAARDGGSPCPDAGPPRRAGTAAEPSSSWCTAGRRPGAEHFCCQERGAVSGHQPSRTGRAQGRPCTLVSRGTL